MHGPELSSSYIVQHQQAERRERQRWMIGIGLVVLHLVYFLGPLLPVAAVRAWLPLFAWFPPVFALIVLVLACGRLWQWQHRRQQYRAFVPIPLPEESQRP